MMIAQDEILSMLGMPRWEAEITTTAEVPQERNKKSGVALGAAIFIASATVAPDASRMIGPSTGFVKKAWPRQGS